MNRGTKRCALAKEKGRGKKGEKEFASVVGKELKREI
jgi:hypothetical protein